MSDAIAEKLVEWKKSPYLNFSRSYAVYSRFLWAIQFEGDVAEFGVAGGDTSLEFVKHLDRVGSDKKLHLFDTFTGNPAGTAEDAGGYIGKPKWDYALTEEDVKKKVNSPRCQFYKGYFAQYKNFNRPLCFAHVDANLYQSTLDALKIAAENLVVNGVIVVDDYGSGWVGVTKACDQVFGRHLGDTGWAVQWCQSGNFRSEIGPGLEQLVAVKKQ